MAAMRMIRVTASASLLFALAFSAVAAASVPQKALADCRGKPQVKPRSVVLSCADGNFGFGDLTWFGWGGARAVALGTAFANDCTPDCASGHFHNYQGVLIVSGTQRCPDGMRAYAIVSYAFIGRSPFPAGSLSSQKRPCRPLP
jgi:hypothetical protein